MGVCVYGCVCVWVCVCVCVCVHVTEKIFVAALYLLVGACVNTHKTFLNLLL